MYTITICRKDRLITQQKIAVLSLRETTNNNNNNRLNLGR